MIVENLVGHDAARGGATLDLGLGQVLEIREIHSGREQDFLRFWVDEKNNGKDFRYPNGVDRQQILLVVAHGTQHRLCLSNTQPVSLYEISLGDHDLRYAIILSCNALAHGPRNCKSQPPLEQFSCPLDKASYMPFCKSYSGGPCVTTAPDDCKEDVLLRWFASSSDDPPAFGESLRFACGGSSALPSGLKYLERLTYRYRNRTGTTVMPFVRTYSRDGYVPVCLARSDGDPKKSALHEALFSSQRGPSAKNARVAHALYSSYIKRLRPTDLLPVEFTEDATLSLEECLADLSGAPLALPPVYRTRDTLPGPPAALDGSLPGQDRGVLLRRPGEQTMVVDLFDLSESPPADLASELISLTTDRLPDSWKVRSPADVTDELTAPALILGFGLEVGEIGVESGWVEGSDVQPREERKWERWGFFANLGQAFLTDSRQLFPLRGAGSTADLDFTSNGQLYKIMFFPRMPGSAVSEQPLAQFLEGRAEACSYVRETVSRRLPPGSEDHFIDDNVSIVYLAAPPDCKQSRLEPVLEITLSPPDGSAAPRIKRYVGLYSEDPRETWNCPR